jgi:hypothetical protein
MFVDVWPAIPSVKANKQWLKNKDNKICPEAKCLFEDIDGDPQRHEEAMEQVLQYLKVIY